MELYRQIIEKRNLGYNASGISKLLGRDVSVIRRRLYRLLGSRDPKLKPIPQSQIDKMAFELNQNGKNLNEIREMFPYSPSKINKLLAPLYKPKGCKLQDFVVEMYKLKFSQEIISKTLGITLHMVKKHLTNAKEIEYIEYKKRKRMELKAIRERVEKERKKNKIPPYYLRRGKIIDSYNSVFLTNTI